MNERTHLDLFSGIGGFALAAQWNGVRTVGFCEREPYAQQVLRERFGAPIHEDIRTLDGTAYRGVWLLTGGFPCQPFSLAGKRLGASDDRALWPEMLRVIDQAGPAWVLGENVSGIVSMELDRVLSDLERIGYSCRPFVVPACAVDALHRRDRVWIVAHAEGGGIRRCAARGAPIAGKEGWGALTDDPSEALADANQQRLERSGSEPRQGRQVELPQQRCVWEPEPDVGRVANGVPSRAHRLRGLGNAIVPQVAAEFIRFMIQAEQL